MRKSRRFIHSASLWEKVWVLDNGKYLLYLLFTYFDLLRSLNAKEIGYNPESSNSEGFVFGGGFIKEFISMW